MRVGSVQPLRLELLELTACEGGVTTTQARAVIDDARAPTETFVASTLSKWVRQGLVERTGHRRAYVYAATQAGHAALAAGKVPAPRLVRSPGETPTQSATQRMRSFFLQNPHEELTADDVAAKFDVHPATVHSMAHRLQSEGVIESVRLFRACRRSETA